MKQSTELEQDIAAYIERCGQLGRSPKGRVMLSIIARHYDLDRVRGSVLAASTLFQIELGGNSIKDLRDFVNHIRLVLSAIPVGQRPDDRLIEQSTSESLSASLRTFVNRLPLLIVENGLTCGIRFRI